MARVKSNRTMGAWFYQANFCAECGNRREARRWWQHRYFCAECAARKGQRHYFYFALLACVIGGPLLGWTLGNIHRETTLAHLTPSVSATSSSPSTVSAQDAAVQLKPPPSMKSEVYVICGARTKRGTPCKHRVPPGQRCAQHKGQPSIDPAAISQNGGRPSSKAP